MKEITKEKTYTQNYTVYVAMDGTEFNSCEECSLYEMSAFGIVSARVASLHIANINEFNLFDAGSEEYIYNTYKANSETDKENLLQYLILGAYLNSDFCNKNIEKFKKDSKGASFDEIYIFGHSLDDDRHISYYGTVNNTIKSISDKLNGKVLNDL